MRVLITGGTGFIGSRLALHLAERGDGVTVLAQANTPAEVENADLLTRHGCEIVLGSVVDAPTVQKAVAGAEVVYHLAAAQHESNVDDQHFRDVNVTGTGNVLEAAAKAGVRRFVHGSTIGVYRATGGSTVHEDTVTEPDNIYGVTKLEAERLVAGHADGLAAVIVRISETYGPGDRRLLKLFRAVARRRFFHVGRGDNLHHLLYIDDLVQALRVAARGEDAIGRTVVVPGYEAVTTREMVAAVARSMDAPVPRLRVPLLPLWLAAAAMELTMPPLGMSPPLHRRRMHFFIKSFRFDGAKARSLLGYEPKVGVAEGMRRTAEWYRSRGEL